MRDAVGNLMSWDRKGREYILTLDLETTGSKDEDYILEIGAIITDREFNEVDAKQIVLPITGDMEDGLVDVVREMHTTNGLLEDCRTELADSQEGFIQKPEMMIYKEHLALADREMAAWVKKYNGSDHMPMSGSGVSHYDRKYIKRDLPLFDSRLTYWMLDIGVVRRYMELAGVQLTASTIGDTIQKTHRALDDARVHAAESRRFLIWARDR